MKEKPTRSSSPLPAVILGIDPGATSGWAILTPQPLLERIGGGYRYGQMRLGELEVGHGRIVQIAQSVAEELKAPLVVVAEKWSAGGWASHATLLGLGAAWGAWQVALREANHPKRRIVRVYTQTWRSAIIGGRHTTEEWKMRAQARIRHRFGLDAGPDASEAGCIALWGSHAGEVAEVLPKRRSRA